MAEATSKHGHGGARPGAGRPKAADPKLTKNVTLPASVWAEIERRNPEKPVHRALAEMIEKALELGKQRQEQQKAEQATEEMKAKNTAGNPVVCKIQADDEKTEIRRHTRDLMREPLRQMYWDRRHNFEASKTERAYDEIMTLEIVWQAIDPIEFKSAQSGFKMPRKMTEEEQERITKAEEKWIGN